MRKLLILLMVVLLAALLSACGEDEDSSSSTIPRPTPAPDTEAALGLALFQDHCAACHETRNGNDRQIVGPSLDNIAQNAADRVDGMSAEEYLHQSILEPDAHLVEGFQPGSMQQNFATLLSDEEVDHLVVYLMTLD